MATKISKLEFSNIKPTKLPLVIGYFGSIHVMHSQLFDKYHRYNVLTFNDFAKKLKTQLYPFDERIKNIANFNPINIFVYDISKHNMKAEEFIHRVLLPLQPSSIIVGSNFKFGSDHKPCSILNKYFTVETVNHNKRVSTTIISDLLMNKKVERANSLLFTPYYYISKWIKGNGKGKEIGVRTINTIVDYPLHLSEGSYVSKIKLGNRTFNAVTFVGKSKTFNNKQFVLETHVIKKHIPPRSLYVKSVRDNVRIEFCKFIRSNTKYKNYKLLVKAIEKDIQTAQKYFNK